MYSLNVHEAKTRLSALLAQVESTGEKILICRNGKPIADLVPHKHTDRTAPHPKMSLIKIDYDPTEPLQDDEWLGDH